MPEFTVKEVRLPELHLPEIKREDIVRSLSGVRLPEVDLGKAAPSRLKAPAGIKMPAVSLNSGDVAKLMAAAAAVARFTRPTPARKGLLAGLFSRSNPSPIARIVPQRRRRSRLPIVLAVVVVGAMTAWAILRQPKVRQRLDEAATAARERLDAMRAGQSGTQADVDVPIVFSAASTAPIQTDGYSNATDDASAPSGGSDYPDGLGAGSGEGDGVPAFEETGSQG
jgi:hypothetical protein